MGLSHKPGLYDRHRRLIRDAAYFRGLPKPHYPLEEPVTTASLEDAPYAPEGARYYFAGHLTGHYGHFLFSMLGRLWALPRPVPADLRLVLLNGVNAPDLFELDFSRTLFDAMGLQLSHFATFTQPVRFRTIEVAGPAIEENHRGHFEFADLCHRLGGDLLPAEVEPKDHFVFLTKQALPSGVHTVVNEAAFCAVLEDLGVEIISPESRPFKEQVRLWAERPIMSGLFGSMMHTSIFLRGRSYVALNPEPWINSNQVILDRLNGNDARILFPKGGYKTGERNPRFDHTLQLREPEKAARAFFEALRSAREDHDMRSRGAVARRPLSDHLRALRRRISF